MPNLNTAILSDVPAVVPPLSEQRAIAEVLGALDDKIESNRRVAESIHELLRAEFQSAIEGHTLEQANQALDVQMGAPFSGHQFSERGAGRPLIRIRDLKTYEPQIWTTEVRPDEREIHPGDVLVGMDAEFRSTFWLGPPGVLNQRVCRFVPRDDVGRAFALLALRPDLQFYESAKSGTTVIHLNKADIDCFTVPSLSRSEHADFAGATEPLVGRWVAAALESRSLVLFRDVLLPELLSGRLRVPVREEVVARAT